MDFILQRYQSVITVFFADGKLQFLQVPLLTIDGLQLVQCNAIVRYLARRAGMDGDTPEEKAR